jgi:hypothetical protein
MMAHSGIIVQEEYGGLRTSAFVFCVESLMSDGHVEDAWQLMTSYTSAPWFITNAELHMLYGSVAVARAVVIANEAFARIPLDKLDVSGRNVAFFAASRNPDLQRWFLPSMHDISLNPHVFANVALFLASNRIWKLGVYQSKGQGGNVYNNKRLGIMKEIQTALERAAKKDKSADYFQLQEYYCAMLFGLKARAQAVKHIKSLLSEVRRIRQQVTIPQNSPEERSFAAKESLLWRLLCQYLVRTAFARNDSIVKRLAACRSVQDIDGCTDALMALNTSEDKNAIKQRLQCSQILDCIRMYVSLSPESSPEMVALGALLHRCKQLSTQEFVEILLRMIDVTPLKYSYADSMPLPPHMQVKSIGTSKKDSRKSDSTSSAVPVRGSSSPESSAVNNRLAWRLWSSLTALLGPCREVDASSPLDKFNDELHYYLFDKPIFMEMDSRIGGVKDESYAAVHDEANSLFAERSWWRHQIFAEHTLGNCVPCITDIEVDKLLQDPLYAAVATSSISSNDSDVFASDLYSICLRQQRSTASHSTVSDASNSAANSGDGQTMNAPNSHSLFDRPKQKQAAANSVHGIESITNEEHLDSLLDSDNEAEALDDEHDEDFDSSEDDSDGDDGEDEGGYNRGSLSRVKKEPKGSKDKERRRKSKAKATPARSQQRMSSSSTSSSQMAPLLRYCYKKETLDMHILSRCLYFVGAGAHNGTMFDASITTGENWMNEFLSGELVGSPNDKEAFAAGNTAGDKKRKLSAVQEHRYEGSSSDVSETFASEAVPVKKRVYELFSRTQWERTSFGSHEKFTRLKIDVPQYLHYSLDRWELELLTHRVIVCAHFMSVYRQKRQSKADIIGQDCMFVARGVQIIVMHALLEIDAFHGSASPASASTSRERGDTTESASQDHGVISTVGKDRLARSPEFVGLRCISLLMQHNINIHRAIRIALTGACKGVDSNKPMKQTFLLPRDKAMLLQSTNTLMYNPKY